MTYSICIHW